MHHTAGALLANSFFDTSRPIPLKVYSNERFLFQLTNDLCRSFTKIVIILLFSKAVFFIKKNFVISIFCAKNITTIKVLF